VQYPWHPLAGQEVLVRGRTSHAGVASYVIVQPDDTLCALPVWMTRDCTTEEATLREVGLASLAALEALRALVDEIREAWARSAASPAVPPTSGDVP
jgi:hypothetical protein